MAEEETRVRFRANAPLKDKRRLRVAASDTELTELGDLIDIISIYLTGVDDQEFASVNAARNYIEALEDEKAFGTIMTAFSEFRKQLPPPPPTNGGSSAPS